MVKKAILVLACALASGGAIASVHCTGVPQAAKVGEFGAQEEYFIVTLNGLDFRLGPISDQGARSRMAVATAAVAANKTLLLRFWDPYSDCSVASSARAIPNSVQLLQ